MSNIFKITGVIILATHAVSSIVFGTHEEPLTTGVAISLAFGLANLIVGGGQNDRSSENN